MAAKKKISTRGGAKKAAGSKKALKSKAPKKHARLTKFLTSVAKSPSLQTRMQTEPEKVMKEHNLGVLQRRAVKSGPEAVSRLLGRSTANTTSNNLTARMAPATKKPRGK
jgi:hypothetical protein